MILVIDNYDSFTYNLVQYIGEVSDRNRSIQVVRNDQISVEDVAALAPHHLVISPGPCTPNEAGISIELIQRLSGKVPILGVCLGHQAIGQAFGGVVIRAERILHGKTSKIRHDESSIFTGIAQDFVATRYHSLLVERASLPDCLRVTAWSKDNSDEIMGFCHREHRSTVGVQFHPESILTSVGKELLYRFLSM